jgi:AraC-like DNA-binding protein
LGALLDHGVNLFRTRTAADARDLLSTRYKPHKMRTLDETAFDFMHMSASVPVGSFNILRYGSAVEIKPEPFGDFFMLEMPVKAGVDIEESGSAFGHSNKDTALFLAPDLRIASTWRADCTQLMLKISDTEGLSRRRTLTGDDTAALPRMSPRMDLRTIEGWRVSQLMLLLREELERAIQAKSNTLAQTPMAGAVVNAVLDYYRVHDGNVPEAGRQVLPAHLRHCVAYIHDHLTDDLSVPVLLDQTDVSERSLFKLFRQFLNTTPLGYVQQQRLKHARSALLEGEKVSVAARQAGFSHLGRFSALYRKTYGENPSVT